MIACKVHVCKCKECKEGVTCLWRTKAIEFINKEFKGGVAAFLGNSNTDRLTYCNVLQLHGKLVSTRPREINMLNIVAHLPKCQPLQDTHAVIDMSQGIDWLNIQTDGTVQTMATNSTMLSLQDGCIITELQMAALMGHDCHKLHLNKTSPSQLKKMIGNAVHVSIMGLAMFALLATIGGGNTTLGA